MGLKDTEPELEVTSEPASASPAGAQPGAALQGWQSGMGNAAIARLLSPHENVRSQVESDTGFDLSAAEIKPASPLADSLGVEGLTVGQEVHLGSRTPGPETAHGGHVLAHELTHVVQQGTGTAGATSEREAERTAERSRSASAPARAPALQSLPAPRTPVRQFYDPRFHRRSLVHGLEGSGFSDKEIGQIYAANWERDMSQAHPALANVALKWKELKIAAVGGKRPLEPYVQAFNGSVDTCLELGNLLKIKTAEAYGGYRFFEHMDNPGAEPELDPKTAKTKSEKEIEEARKNLYADAGGIPRYMADGRDYIKAQLIRAAEAYTGTAFDAAGAVGATREAWKKRQEELEKLVPHDPSRPVVKLGSTLGFGGEDPGTAVIAQETAMQAEELRKAGPGATYDGEKAAPATEPPPAPGPAPVAPLEDRKPLSGPKFNEMVDKRFYAENPHRAGDRLDTKNPDDADDIQKWLRIRDQVREENRRHNERIAQAKAEAEKASEPPPEASQNGTGPKIAGAGAAEGAGTAKGLSPVVADALGRASHGLQDFWSHSNFVELTLGIKLQQINPGNRNTPGGTPSNVDEVLQTSTFSANDSSHSLAHKIRAVADEIETEVALINRVTGRGPDPDPSQLHPGSEAHPTETHEEPQSVDEALENDPTMKDIVGRIKSKAIGQAIGGGLFGGLAGAGIGFLIAGPAGAVVGGILGGLIGGVAGGIGGAKAGLKEAAREVIATPRGVALLRSLAEGMEEETRKNQEMGSHSQIAKDQPGHEHDDPMNELRTLRFEVSQECSVEADKQIIGGMKKVLDADPAKVEVEMQAILESLDKLIGQPGESHPFYGMIKKHQKTADDAVRKLLIGRSGDFPTPSQDKVPV